MTEPTRIRSVEVEPLDVPLSEPFTIAIGKLERVENLLVTVVLDNGVVGYGESAPFPVLNGEDQATASAAIRSLAPSLVGADVADWQALAAGLERRLWAQSAARAGLEIALVDAAAKSTRRPLWRLFGPAGAAIETDISIPLVDPERTRALAAAISARGVRTIKLKVAGDVEPDIARIVAAHQAAPRCRLTLDANQGYNADGALELCDWLRIAGLPVALFEQPVPRHDDAALARVAVGAGIPVAADEAVFRAHDLDRLAAQRACQVVNIKLMKSGLAEAVRIVERARHHGIGLMIGQMIETRLATAAAAHLAAGLGGFAFVDLDTPLLLAEDPIAGGYVMDRGGYFLGDAPGHGCWPKGRTQGLLA